ncbi:GSCFA domain-containing protein [Achromobacter insolitus]|uniref:GSCFA domain-containing protein n=1 Tax=Achromobacter insolitus TaxID=217204 RepID=UPI0020A57A3B|nr:GSCFA domain-containing protein [Achromobacter insolitus]MCP1404416.1 hypothetical protein [Achromobacter insolitus]
MSAKSPYQDLPAKSFWRSVRDRHYFDLEDLSQPVKLSLKDKVATAGSCFAQHIGRYLMKSGAEYLDMEPCPSIIPEADAKRFGYNVYSCRYGNVYTVRQLLQLAQEAQGLRKPAEIVWEKGGRYFDALRPSVDPVGLETPEQVLAMRELHLEAVRKMFEKLDVFVFTMGLTEAWVSKVDGTAYPTAAGTIAGSHDPAKYEFKNYRYNEVMDDLREFWRLLKAINPSARMLLTVSPVPLNATASADHVLVASSRSKSILRAVAGDIAEDEEDVFYFPSYEIIASHPGRGMFFEPDLRNVNDAGVQLVMKHFFTAFNSKPVEVDGDDDIICEEAQLEKFAK